MSNESIIYNTPPINPKDKAKNPLKSFRSYSYFFILMAMDTTDYLSPKNIGLVNSTSGNFYQRPYQGPDPARRRSVITDKGIGKRVILIDGREDTDFIIDNVEWGTTFVGDTNSSNSTVGFDTYLSEGRMTIFEPRGMSFLNVLADTCDTGKLDTDPTSLPFMLKVIFVGQDDNNNVTAIYDVPPFGIYLTDITGSFDEMGATYEISYVGAINGASWVQTYDSIVDGITFHFIDGLSLEDHLSTFTTQINDRYKYDRKCMIDRYAKIGIDASKTCNIEWKLEIDPKAPGGKFFQTLKDFGTNAPPQNKSNGANNQAQFIGTKEGGIAEVIHKLFESSKQYQAERMKSVDYNKDFSGTKYQYKITTECTKSSPTNGNLMSFHYLLDEYVFNIVNIPDGSSGQGAVKIPKIDPKDVYEYDYIYTGQNVDIIDFDMKLSMGYALWLSLITTQSLPSQIQDIQGDITKHHCISSRPLLSGSLNPKLQLRKGTPLWPAALMMDVPTKEFQNQGTVASANQIWRNFMRYQAVQSELTIHGNPMLIQKYTQPDKNSPDYVKINVKMPTTTDDVWEYDEQNNSQPGGYYKNFWFHGYFNIITARNKFQGGDFQQHLTLIELPQQSSDMTVTAGGSTSNTAPNTTAPTQSNTSSTTYSATNRTISEASQQQKQTPPSSFGTFYTPTE